MLSTNLVFLGIAFLVGLTNGVPLDVDPLTPEQRASLTNITEILSSYELPQDYMKQEYFLTNFLKMNNFEVDETLEILYDYLQFRRWYKVDGILEEDWSDLRALFPYSRDTVDRRGQPILYVDMGKWDAVNYLTSDEAFDRFIRYNVMVHEESYTHVRRLRSEGRDISKYSEIINVAGFSVGKHACIKCGYFYRNITQLLAPFAPAKMERASFINVPYLFKMVYFFFSEETRKFVHLYGQDQKQLENMLLDFIDRDQLPKGIFDHFPRKDNAQGEMTWNKEL